MKIQINVNELKTLKLTPNQYLYLVCLSSGVPLWFDLSAEEFDFLQDNGFIKLTNEGVVVRAKSTKLIAKNGIVDPDDLESFVDQYRALFPSGVKTGGYPVKGDKQECIKKMRKFLASHDFTKSEILEATRVYLTIKKKELWKATQLAHYYIEKDGISNLASMCEDIRENGNTEKGNVGTVEGIN